MASYSPNSRKICPHCKTVVRFELAGTQWGNVPYLEIRGTKELANLTMANCPECGRLIVTSEPFFKDQGHIDKEFVVWPLQSTRPPVPNEVPSHIAADYNESALVFSFSPKASAALSRRCLQAVLREVGKANQHDLSKQIDAVMPSLPSYIAQSIDAIRNIGNFAAHPLKGQDSGQIMDVEPGEAEWNLDVLDQLFDFYYVQPALAKQKRDALDAKLKDAGKPPMK